MAVNISSSHLFEETVLVKKMTKEQSLKFDKLYETTLSWGDDSNCIGLFEPFGKNLEWLTTCVQGDNMEILDFDGSYYDLVTVLPINKTTKGKLKRIVEHLMYSSWDTLVV